MSKTYGQKFCRKLGRNIRNKYLKTLDKAYREMGKDYG